MIMARIVGSVTATRKAERLNGVTFLLARPYTQAKAVPDSGLLIVADPLGAGPGEDVILATGRAARIALGLGDDIPVDATVIGIVDGVDLNVK